MGNAIIQNHEIFCQTIQHVNTAQHEVHELVSNGINDCRFQLKETEEELMNSQNLLQIALAIEAEKYALWQAALAELEAALASMDGSWIASATAKEEYARAEYQEAVRHRQDMERRVSMAQQCVQMAAARLEETSSVYTSYQSQMDETIQVQFGRLAQADEKIRDYLSVNQPAVQPTQKPDKNEPGRVPMNPGKDDAVVFVFSCPGQEEEKSGRVCTGRTGEHLDYLVGLLNDERPDVFKYRDRYSYRITNASDRVYYKATTDSTEAPDSDIKDPINIARISDEVKNAKYILCMGRKAHTAVELAHPKGKIIISDHLSLSNLNRNSKYKDMETPSEKIKFIAQQILSQV